MDILNALLGPFTDFMVKFLFFVLIFQTLGFFWFIWVVIRFGLCRRDEPEPETEASNIISSNIISLEEARRLMS